MVTGVRLSGCVGDRSIRLGHSTVRFTSCGPQGLSSRSHGALGHNVGGFKLMNKVIIGGHAKLAMIDKRRHLSIVSRLRGFPSGSCHVHISIVSISRRRRGRLGVLVGGPGTRNA